MKALWGGLLMAGLLLGTAHSLRCYSCTQAATSEACKTDISCSSGSDTFCKKLVGLVAGTVTITRSCVQQCTEGTEITTQGTGNAYCCKTDLCNGAPRARISYALLALAAAVSALLLRAGL